MDGWWADPAAMNHWKSDGPVQNTIEPIGSVIGSMAFNAQVQLDFQCFFFSAGQDDDMLSENSFVLQV